MLNYIFDALVALHVPPWFVAMLSDLLFSLELKRGPVKPKVAKEMRLLSPKLGVPVGASHMARALQHGHTCAKSA